jgi:hypothetical protein
MNQPLSLLTPAAPSAPNAAAPPFPAATARSRAAAPFSAVLERAEYRAPDRPSQTARGSKPAAVRSKVTKEDDSAPEEDRHAPVRTRQKSAPSTEDQHLAGACAVTGPVAPPEDSIPTPATSATATAAATPTPTRSTSADDSASPTAGTETALVGPAPIAAATPNVTAAAPAPAPNSVSPSEVAGGDLPSLVAPLPSVATNSTTPLTIPNSTTPASTTTTTAPTVPTAPALPVPVVAPEGGTAIASTPVIFEPEVSVATNADQTSSAVNSAAPTRSAREAEVLLALSEDLASAAHPDAAATVATSVAAEVIAPEAARQAARAARRFRSETLENAAGIGGAKSNETMKNVIKKEELAGLAQ